MKYTVRKEACEYKMLNGWDSKTTTFYLYDENGKYCGSNTAEICYSNGEIVRKIFYSSKGGLIVKHEKNA